MEFFTISIINKRCMLIRIHKETCSTKKAHYIFVWLSSDYVKNCYNTINYQVPLTFKMLVISKYCLMSHSLQ